MPGKQVKNWKLYEKLRAEGKTKEQAARIANAQASKSGRAKVAAKKGRRGKGKR